MRHPRRGVVGIVTQWINACWQFFKVVVLVLLAAGIGAVVYYSQHFPDELARQIRDKLAARHPQLRVEIHSAQLLPEEGILLRGVTLADPSAPAAEQVLLSADELLLACRTTITELARSAPKITHLVVRRPRLVARVDATGTWNALKLLPEPGDPQTPCEITLDGGQVEVHDARRNPPAVYTLRDVQCALRPLTVETSQTQPAWEVRGKLRGDHLRALEFTGRVEPAGRGATIQWNAQGLAIGPELAAQLPRELAAPLEPLGSLRGELQLTGNIVYAPSVTQPLVFQISGQLQRGRFDDPRLPQVLNDIAANFSADPTGLLVSELTAKSGPTTLRLAAERRGYGPKAPCTIAVEAKQLMIGRAWEEFLSPEIRDTWLKFQPAGEVDVNGRLVFDGTRWTVGGRMQCVNISFTYHRFRYRLDRTVGTMEFNDDHLIGALTSSVGNKRVAINIDCRKPGDRFIGAVTMVGKGLTLDAGMLAALPDNQRKLIQSLNPSGGTFDIDLRATRETEEQPQPRIDARWDLHQVGIKFDKFKYPLNDVSGVIKLIDRQWTFSELVGYNDKGKITCEGTFTPATTTGGELRLSLVGTEVSLEEELRDALPEQARNFWTALNPQGFIDLRAEVTHKTGDAHPAVTLTATPREQTVVIEPTFFPLRIEKIRGMFRYQPNRIEFQDVTAEQERLPLSASGFCEYDGSGAWHLRFDQLIADRVRPERAALQAALPPKLRKVTQSLQLTGPLNLNGSFELWNQPQQTDPLTAAWDMAVDIRDGSITCSQKLEHIDGAVRLVGQTNGAQMRMQGEINVDSLIFNRLQFTNVKGPLWIDETQVLLGSGATPPASGQRRNLTAECYGGNLAVDAWAGLGQNPRFALQSRLDDFDLAQFAREQLPGKQNLSGKIQVGWQLTGTPAGTHTLQGRGQLYLHDANLGELPVMLAMLKILSIREPDRTAFDRGDINFRVDGEHLYFDSIELSGNAISLLGTGEMNKQSELQLVFSAVAGRSDWQIPVIKNVLGQASQQFMEIQVGGTLSEPEIKREAFPALKQSLDQLQAERRQRKPTR